MPVSISSQQEFSDADFRIVDNGDQSKKLAFQVSGVSANTTRTWTVPNANGTVLLSSTAYAADSWAFLPVGVPFPVFDNITGVSLPPKDQSYRYIVLTAGLTGSGQYNENVLDGESVTGSAPLVLATATINDPGGALDNQTVQLINTAGRVIYGGTTAGSVFNDQMQEIAGTLALVRIRGADNRVTTGAFNLSNASGVTGVSSNANSSLTVNDGHRVNFDSSGSTDARTGTSTRAKGVTATWVMRIH